MRLPSGTRMCLLLVFAFLLITTEFPEFSRFKALSRAKAPGIMSEGELIESDDDGELADLTEATAGAGYRSTILVQAWGYGGWGYRRRWGGGGWGRGWGGGWGRRRYGGWGGGWGYRRRCCWGKRR